MTRINTNVSSLNAQKTLARSNAQLQESLTRLSTGLRINSGKDDPAGLIASEALRSDIVSTQVAISNSERANQMIATADSALGQVSTLLNDIRGLVSEAANAGAMSSEQIAANQLQVDSSLEAVDRIAQVTQFQGKRLLDGSLDFISEGVDAGAITDLQVDQANFGSQSEIPVSVSVDAQAEKGSLTYASATASEDVVLEVGGTSGYEAFNFAAGSTIEEMAAAINLVSDSLGISADVVYDTAEEDSYGYVTLSSVGDDNDIVVTADTIGRTGGDIDVVYNVVEGLGDTTAASVDNADGSKTITVSLDAETWVAASGTNIGLGVGGGTIDLAAKFKGEDYNGITLNIAADLGNGATPTATYVHSSKTIFVHLAADGVTSDNVAAGITNDLSNLFTAAVNVSNAITAGEYADVTANGRDGGTILSTATQVMQALNDDVGTLVTAALASGDSGATAVTALTQRAYIGSPNTGNGSDMNNYLQFLGPDGAADLDVRLVAAGANQTLGIDLVGNAETGGYATAVVQSDADNGSFVITANNAGEEYNVKVIFDDTTADDPPVVTWDAEAGEIRITGDFETGAFTANDIITAINNDAVVSEYFTAAAFGTGDGGLVNVPASGGTLEMATLSGGNEYTGVTINLATDADGTVTTTAADLIAFVNAGGTGLDTLGISVSNAGTSDGSGLLAAGTVTFGSENITTSEDYAGATTNNEAGVDARMTITAKTAGAAYDGVKVNFHHDANVTAGVDEYVTYDAETKELNIYISSGNSTVQNVLDRLGDTASAAAAALFSFEAVGDGTGKLSSSDVGGTTSGGVVESGAAAGVHLLDNNDEGDVLSSTSLTFTSTEYGSDAFVSVKALEGTFNCQDATGATKTRDTGSNVEVRINGLKAVSKGLAVAINTSALDMSFTIDADVTAGTELNFRVTEGGAQFQLGPDVVSTQQARLGIQSISTSKLGGASGQLFQLRSGGVYSLSANTAMATKVVEEAISAVTTLRGRLGAFQSTTLQSNIDVLSDTLEGLTEAESSIRDADFAEESANLTRAQILVQSGVSVLSMANSNPQNVLALLR